MGDRDAIEGVWRSLRRSAHSEDPALIPAAVQAAVEVGLLQESASAARAALRSGAEAEAAVALLSKRLRARGWEGDDVAAEALGAGHSGSSSGRRAIRADLEMLASALDDQRGGYLDLTTGDCLPMSVVEDGDLDLDELGLDLDAAESERWVYVPGDSREAWRDMASFADHIDDDRVREDLQRAIHGSGAFRRFKQTLDRHDTYWIDWRVWSHERALGRARQWLADQGYEAV